MLAIGLWAGWVQGADSNWIASTGDWSDANNWSGGEPTSGAWANISNGGTATISQPGEACYSLTLGSSAGESGTIDLVSGSLRTRGSWSDPRIPELPWRGPPGLFIGYSGTGVLTHADGNNTVRENLWLGFGTGSSGTYLLSGSGLLEANTEHIGSVGQGYFAQTGGVNRPVTISIGPHGRYELTGGALVVTGVSPDPFVFDPDLGLFVSGTFVLGGNACVGVATEVVGLSGNGVFTHTDGNNVVHDLFVGYYSGSSGTYYLSGDAHLTAADRETVGYIGSGAFIQSGGHNDVGSVLYIGRMGSGSYSMSGGVLTTAGIGVFNGEFSITDSSASIAVSFLQISSPGGRFSAVPGSVIHVTRPPSWAWWRSSVGIYVFDGNAAGDLSNLRLVFENGADNVATFEVAGIDLGATPDGFLNNFALETLELGGAAGDGRVVLWDHFDSHPGWDGNEALYVNQLIVHPGSTLYLDNIGLYVNGVAVSAGDGDLYGGGVISAAPEPVSMMLLACGAVLLSRHRRRRETPLP